MVASRGLANAGTWSLQYTYNGSAHSPMNGHAGDPGGAWPAALGADDSLDGTYTGYHDNASGSVYSSGTIGAVLTYIPANSTDVPANYVQVNVTAFARTGSENATNSGPTAWVILGDGGTVNDGFGDPITIVSTYYPTSTGTHLITLPVTYARGVYTAQLSPRYVSANVPEIQGDARYTRSFYAGANLSVAVANMTPFPAPPAVPHDRSAPEDGDCGCGSNAGPESGDPVNTATGAERYSDGPDIAAYNPGGPGAARRPGLPRRRRPPGGPGCPPSARTGRGSGCPPSWG